MSSYRRSVPPPMRARGGSALNRRGLPTFHTTAEFLFRREVLIERIGWYPDLDLLAAAGDDRRHRGGDLHVMRELSHVLLRLFLASPKMWFFGPCCLWAISRSCEVLMVENPFL